MWGESSRPFEGGPAIRSNAKGSGPQRDRRVSRANQRRGKAGLLTASGVQVSRRPGVQVFRCPSRPQRSGPCSSQQAHHSPCRWSPLANFSGLQRRSKSELKFRWAMLSPVRSFYVTRISLSFQYSVHLYIITDISTIQPCS